MKFDIINNIFRIALPALLLLSGSCTKEKTSGLELDADVSVLSFALDEYQGEVDLQTSVISVPVPADCDPSAMTVTELEIPEGAEATVIMPDGQEYNIGEGKKTFKTIMS